MFFVVKVDFKGKNVFKNDFKIRGDFLWVYVVFLGEYGEFCYNLKEKG